MEHNYQPKKHRLLAKMLFVMLCAFLSISVQAQTEIADVKNYLTANAAKQNLTAADIAEMTVSSSYFSSTTDWYHIYFNQTYQSVEVYNALLNVTLKNGQVEYVANSFVAGLAFKVPSGNLKTLITPVQAIQKAATSVNLTANSITEVSSTTLPNGIINKASYLDPAISNDKIEVKLCWLPYEVNDEGKTKSKVLLTWNVRIMTKDGQNAWNIHVDALSGNILQTYDDVIHCNFGTPEHNKAPHICLDKKIPTSANSKMLVANSYNVFDYPLEAPTFGSRTVVLNPYTKFVPTGTGPGTTNGWHNDGTTNFTNTRGNNVWAKEDLAADNEVTIGASPISATLDFNYAYTQATGTAAANLNAAITNMYYWNNVMHDVLWKFGFDEPGGNFQKDNLSRGGAGNDFVFADAQDGSGTNNANFSTPADGSNPRMQMYIFSNAGSPAYQPDSDFDNGVIAHEYGHGWSNRLTGGPAIVNCLQNAEQAGEGWSDYIALMTITNWSTLTPTVASANIPRGIGTYVLGQLTTGPGIRPFPYSYDKTNVNPLVTYAGVGNAGVFSLPHGIGSIWATMLWDMTWEIILQDNQIVNDIYDVPASIANYRGNIAALKLVNEGLRLQPCSPSFVQARDAILQADQMLFAGRYRCAISRAFTRRGLGALASTGASSNDRTVTEDFTPISGPGLSSPNSANVCSNSPFAYTATTAAAGSFVFAWTRAAVAGISNPAASASSANINETLINTTSGPITVTYFFTISPDACGGTPAQQPVNVIVKPTIVPTVATYNVCQNAAVPAGGGLVVPVALTNTVNGALVSGTTYIRGGGNSTTIYTASRPVFFKTYTFVAPTSGAVTFETTAAVLVLGGDDTYLSLYQTAFIAGTPATNFLQGDDDSGPGFLSSLTQTLVAGTTYIIVVSSFDTGDTGPFTLRVGVPVFPDLNNWFTASTGGAAIFTGEVFNPVGVAGSGIPNTATPGSTPFYVATAANPTCRATTTFNIISTTAPIVGIITQPSCVTSTGSVVLSGLPSTGTWTINPGGITGTGASTTITGLVAGTTYNFTVTSATCVSAPSANVVINAIPSPPTGATAGSNSPVAEGSPINLTSSSTGGTSQVWTGPGFTSAAQNPVIASATVAMGGVYTVIITSSGSCTAMATTNVTVTPTSTVCTPPTGATAGSNSPITAGNPINLTSSSTGGTSQVWTGPSFTSAAQNPVIASATVAMGGVYTVIITSSGTCTAMATTSVTVVALPTNTVVFVNQANAAAPIQNGLTWATAYSNLQTALAAAPANSEIWVAQGTYKPTTTTTKIISFNIPSGAIVYGGFVGTETMLSQRDFTANATILSGEIGLITNPQDNSYHVVFFNGVNNLTRLDGFTIADGNSNYTPPSSIVYPSGSILPVSINDGGGIALDNGSSPTIINCRIINNRATIGGGIFATNNSTPMIINCAIMGNQSTFGGGAYHLGSNAVYKNVLFSGNKALGGAVYNNSSNSMLTNVTIVGNGGNNGAVFNSASNPVIKNAVIFGNVTPFNDTQSIVTYSLVEGGYPGIGNLNLNPQFINMTPSGLAPTLTGNNRVINTSPAIDGGENGAITLTDKDLVGNLRRYNGGIVDMGAYEFQGYRVGGTVISIVSGNWESNSTWNIGRSPLAGDNVIINNNHNVTILNTGTAKNVEIKTNAKLIHNTSSSKLQTGI